MAKLFCAVGFLMSSAWLFPAQITIIDSGSTNERGMSVKLENSGPQAMIELRGGSQQRITLGEEMCGHLMDDLKEAGPLSDLPVTHCMKSASFGKSIFIEYNGVRSPDLSCPQSDSRSAALKKDATEILSQARTQATAKR